LITGPPGSGRSNLAFRFAASLIARNEADREAVFRQVRAHTHPDLGVLTTQKLVIDIRAAREIVDAIHVDDSIKDYIVSLVCASRDPGAFKVPVKDLVQYGASPRATLALAQASRAKAFLDGRGFVVPQDVKDVAPAVLRHRLGLSYEAEALEKTSDDVVRALLEHVPVP
jgi:MoxR-like ATPase